MLRRLIHAWRLRRATTEQECLALRVGPHIARDIGIGYPVSRPVTISLTFCR